jgi:nicotinamidase-related amidase
MEKRPSRLTRSKAGLIVIDIQERLLPSIFENERLIQTATRLIKGAAILEIPIFVTEQYPKGLGPTNPTVAAAIEGFAPMEKVAFSACGAAGFKPALEAKQVTDAILCGMETHVCVLHTALDLLEQGLQVFVVADAVSSRAAESYRWGLERIRDAGAIIATTEMVLFELLQKAGGEQFKQIVALVK